MTNVQEDIEQATYQLAKFIDSTNYQDIPIPVKEHAKMTLADTVGVALRGSFEPEMVQLYKKFSSGKGSTILKNGFPKAEPNVAAFLNATATCFLELDEGSRPTGHPSLHIFPVSLALSQALNKSGTDFLTAFIIGYEVQYCIQKATRLRKMVHPHGNFGQVGAVAAIGKIMNWTVDQLQEGINAAAALTMGTSWQPCIEGATIRNAFPGLTAQIAFSVKNLVESGFTGYRGALSETFGEILGEHFSIKSLTDKLGEKYGIQENYFKFHAACALVHPALDAAANALGTNLNHGKFPTIRTKNLLNPKTINHIKVRVAKNAIRLNNVAKENQLSSKFSIPYAVAMFLVKGNAGLDNFQGEILTNQEISSLAKKVIVEEDFELSSKWPHEAAAQITIEMKNGNLLAGNCTNPYGSTANPPLKMDLFAKFCSLTSMIFNEPEKRNIWESLLDIDSEKDMSLFLKG
ncbi:MmgE/PrpD family protein [Lentibacillus sp. N15]|uniref:MmgE/PrpD family protein n=1 Tax=Lentibacillus songyuanensis TaxID=3136161 RepID=UPI0031B9CB4D